MILRTGEDTLIWRRKLWIALCGGIVLEEALDLSSDRILNDFPKHQWSRKDLKGFNFHWTLYLFVMLVLQRLKFLLVYVKTVSMDVTWLHFKTCFHIALASRNYGLYVPQQYTRIVYDSTSGTGALHLPYLHTLVISPFFFRHILCDLFENSAVTDLSTWRPARYQSR